MGISKIVEKMYGCSDQSLCIPGTLGLKEMCVLFFFFIFVQNMLTCALMRTLLDSTSPVIFFQQISTTDHQSTPLF